MKSWTQRYLEGEHELVWAEMRDIGDLVRDPEFLDDAINVARETMCRVRRNIEILLYRLVENGFLESAENHLVPPRADIEDVLTRFETVFGPLPLSVRAFALEVGYVNFWTNSDLQFFDPIELSFGADEFESSLQFAADPQYQNLNLFPHLSDPNAISMMAFGSDSAAKGGYSGDMVYYPMPCPQADFRFYGAEECDWFVDYLRVAIFNGGFGYREAVVIDSENYLESYRTPISRPLPAEITSGLREKLEPF